MARPILTKWIRRFLHLAEVLFVTSLCLPIEASGAHVGSVIGLAAWIASLIVIPPYILGGEFHFAFISVFLGGIANIAYVRATLRAYQGRTVTRINYWIGIAGTLATCGFLIWRGADRDDIASYLWFGSLLLWSILFAVIRHRHRTHKTSEPLIGSPQLSG